MERFNQRLGELGDRFAVRMPGSGAWLGLTHPDDIGAVFRAKSDQAHFAEALRMLSPHELVTGPAAITSLDGDAHTVMRRALMPMFAGPALREYEPIIDAIAQELVVGCPTGEPTRVLRYAQRVTLKVIMTVVFGVTDRDRAARLRAAILDLTGEIGSWRFLWQIAAATTRNDGFSRPFPRIEACKAAIDAIVLEEVAERMRGGGPARDDVLGRMLAAGEDGAGLDHAALCEQLRLLLIAGHDTTATTIAWVLERLTHHPEVLAEVERTVRDDDDSYLDAVIHETLRLRPIVPFTVRLTKEPLALDGLTVPPGTLVLPHITLVQRRADIYPDPHSFRPERFLDIRPDGFSWIPFGGGIRRCIGGPLAMMETRSIVRALVQNLDIRAARRAPEAPTRTAIFSAPARGGEIIATPRPSAAVR